MKPDRVVVGANGGSRGVRRARGGALRAARRRDRAHRRGERRDDQARLERLPRHEDQLHQRDRQRLRGARRRRRSRWRAGMGLDDRIGPKFLQPGVGFGGSCFPKDVQALKQLAGNSGYHFQLLTAVIEVNELQKRRTIGKLQKHLGSLVGQGDRAARRGVQAEHRRRARGHQPRARRAARRRGRARARLRPGRGPTRREGMLAGAAIADSALEAVDGADAVVLVTEWPEFARARLGGRGEAAHARCRSWSTAATSSTATRSCAAGFTYEGIGR